MFVKSVTTVTVINSLRLLFATHGIPIIIVSRNVIQFSSTRFTDLCCGLNISHSHFPPNLNGLDEKFVGTMKMQLLLSQ
ncbi:unnamed protein product [Hymenolepis diminuta]|uniref:Integrase catalytic domain-containing protein n=1 Tax=Hymenolepis diminuta TaxID=6216 RepID=A0A564Z1B3_HYMDI|nr:unnamed protein product [Hymenolepis diminuta]